MSFQNGQEKVARGRRRPDHRRLVSRQEIANWNYDSIPLRTPGFAKPHPGLYCDAPPGLRQESICFSPEERRIKAPGDGAQRRNPGCGAPAHRSPNHHFPDVKYTGSPPAARAGTAPARPIFQPSAFHGRSPTTCPVRAFYQNVIRLVVIAVTREPDRQQDVFERHADVLRGASS